MTFNHEKCVHCRNLALTPWSLCRECFQSTKHIRAVSQVLEGRLTLGMLGKYKVRIIHFAMSAQTPANKCILREFTNEVEKSFKLLLNACDNYLLCDKINFLKNWKTFVLNNRFSTNCMSSLIKYKCRKKKWFLDKLIFFSGLFILLFSLL